MGNWKSKNLFNEISTIKSLGWYFSWIFCCGCHCILRFFCRGCFHGEIRNTKSPDFRFFKQLKKGGKLCGQISPFGCAHAFFLGAYLVEFFVGFVAVYSIFSGEALFMEIFAKQNSLFHNFRGKKSFSWLIHILSKL